jgi:hypothetical protein
MITISERYSKENKKRILDIGYDYNEATKQNPDREGEARIGNPFKFVGTLYIHDYQG